MKALVVVLVASMVLGIALAQWGDAYFGKTQSTRAISILLCSLVVNLFPWSVAGLLHSCQTFGADHH